MLKDAKIMYQKWQDLPLEYSLYYWAKPVSLREVNSYNTSNLVVGNRLQAHLRVSLTGRSMIFACC